VLVKTLERCVWFGVILLTAADGCLPKTADAMQHLGEPLVNVAVYNDADAPAGAIAEAEAAAARIFRQAGLEVQWLNCALPGETQAQFALCTQAVFPTHLQLRILRRPRGVAVSTLGLSYLAAHGTGCYSEVFYAEAVDLGVRFGQKAAVILGHAMAHEVGHLLLGTNSHSAFGIMRAHWQPEDLTSAGQGMLVFNRAQSQLMTQKLSSARHLAPSQPVIKSIAVSH
jgi:hypothetical protein